MIFLVLYIFALIMACAIGVRALWSDYNGMIIPNKLVAALPVTFLLAYLAATLAGVEGPFMSPLSHLLSVLVTFGITFVLFSLKIFGAGDSKLITAFSFWFGLKNLPVFICYMAFIGGLLGLMALAIKKKKPFENMREGSWIARLQGGEAVVPYGVAITLGAFFAFLKLGYFAPDSLLMFLGG